LSYNPGADMTDLVTRREFLKRASAAGALGWQEQRAFAASRGQGAAKASPPRLFPFKYSEVKLTGGPLLDQFQRIHRAYLALDEDQVLKVYRQRAGLPAPGPDAGGWYDAKGFAPGHALGQYISGLARFAQATGDEATRAKVERLVNGFAATLGPDNIPYACEKAWREFPAYTYDKHLVGLLDAYRFAGLGSALEVLRRVTRGGLRFLPPRAYDRQFEAPKPSPYDESYTLPENLFYAYDVTKDGDYLDQAKKYLLDKTYFAPLARGKNVLPGRHAYSHVNSLCSAARAYEALGDPMHLDAIRNGWAMLTETQSFASGGWGPNETFVEPNQGKLGEVLNQTHAHFETPCGSYAHLKLARYLLRFTADSRYGDNLERVLYNTVLGASDPRGDGYFFYYSDYHKSAQKDYFPDKWPCCSGTLPQVVADYLISAYFQSVDGIYINLYAPSELAFDVGGQEARLIQETRYPAEEACSIHFNISAPAEFTLFLRIPAWLSKPAEIRVNGELSGVESRPGMFARIRRRWQSSDIVEIAMPFSFRAEPIDSQHPKTVALMRGPLMLVAPEPQFGLPEGALAAQGAFQPVPGLSQTFDLRSSGARVRFTPFYRVQEEIYSTYITLT
jgi:uncharacterized protein